MTIAPVRPRLPGARGPAPRSCVVTGCLRKHFGHGYCQLHLRRVQKTGEPGSVDAVMPTRDPCTFDGCDGPQRGKGLCTGHYQQYKRGKPLTPLKRNQRSTDRDELGRKRCTSCRSWLPEAEFYPDPKMRDRLTSWCKRCDRSARLHRNYGITLDQYEAMLRAQGGGCAICHRPSDEGIALHVDHDHACCPTRKRSCGQCVRGLLCEDCNRVLGMFADHVPRFEAAIDYLKKGGVAHGQRGGPPV